VNDWRALAACRGRDPRVFFPRSHDQFAITVARSVCAGCPVRSECLHAALSAPFPVQGIWGGTAEYERQRFLLRANDQGFLIPGPIQDPKPVDTE
jgi:WhiB family redox-sensing transcriptional regulator